MMVANLNTKERLKNQVDSFPQKKKNVDSDSNLGSFLPVKWNRTFFLSLPTINYLFQKMF
jgi:hypothetical protein